MEATAIIQKGPTLKRRSPFTKLVKTAKKKTPKKQVGMLLKRARLEKHLSLQTLAQLVGTTKGMVCSVEHGGPCSEDAIYKLAKAVDLNPVRMMLMMIGEKTRDEEIMTSIRQVLEKGKI